MSPPGSAGKTEWYVRRDDRQGEHVLSRPRLLLWLGLVTLAGCQVLSGLDDLKSGETASSSVSSSATSGGSGGEGGEGEGGEGEGGEEEECMPAPVPQPCMMGPPQGCTGNCVDSACFLDCGETTPSPGCDVCSTPMQPQGCQNVDNGITQCGPSGYDSACFVTCNGSCSGEIRCPIGAGVACNIDCVEPNSCANTIIKCGDGPCTVVCQQDACDSTTEVVCGGDHCDVNCGGAAIQINNQVACELTETNCQ